MKSILAGVYRKFKPFNLTKYNMKRIDYIRELILDEIQYKDWEFVLKETNDLLFLYANFTDIEGREWTSRKYYLSEHMTDSEIVQTTFLCIKTAEEHEMREEFKFKGAAIFNPHWNVDELVNLLSGDKGDEYLDVRQHG